MGQPRKKRKQYETPRRQWDTQLLERERKLSNTYGLTTKRELRRSETWLKYKRKAAKELLALPIEKRTQRQEELMSGLRKIGLVKPDATLDDTLGLRIDELLEKRLQTLVMRKGLALTPKQARQFVVHGHISIAGKKVTAPGYLVPTEEVQQIGWYRKPIKTETAPKKDIKKEFEEAAGIAGTAIAAEGPATEEPETDKSTDVTKEGK
ncbi:MAG: 30S ribosomal protein S4 [Candidatus Diapherotrites archaeon]|uniref:Small ribosomal subunit protein uS4 n=1 Tax=Candidatus Iainarchaeum sp. TaxID=3101447 RepID=A0A8T3YKQ6_9ARCH|nr:30S ribosomal protein S4 [Candidatus Diapherotrites archaeon]